MAYNTISQVDFGQAIAASDFTGACLCTVRTTSRRIRQLLEPHQTRWA